MGSPILNHSHKNMLKPLHPCLEMTTWSPNRSDFQNFKGWYPLAPRATNVCSVEPCWVWRCLGNPQKFIRKNGRSPCFLQWTLAELVNFTRKKPGNQRTTQKKQLEYRSQCHLIFPPTPVNVRARQCRSWIQRHPRIRLPTHFILKWNPQKKYVDIVPAHQNR